MGSDQQIHSADRLTSPFQIPSNFPVLQGCFVIKGHDIERSQELCQRDPVPKRLRTLVDAVFELTQGDAGDTDLGKRILLNPPQNVRRPLLYQIDTDVRVQQKGRHTSSLSWGAGCSLLSMKSSVK